MGKQEELAKLIRAVEGEGIEIGRFCVVPQGVFFTDSKTAKIFAAKHGKDLVRVDGQISGWLAKNRD